MFLGQEVHYYMVYIAYFTEQNLQICYYAQKQHIRCKIINTRLTKIFMAIFAPDERLPSSATLLVIIATKLLSTIDLVVLGDYWYLVGA